MSSDILQRSVSVGAPSLGNIQALSVSSTTLKVVVPVFLYGAFVRFLARHGDVQFILTFATIAPDLEFDAESIVGVGSGLMASPLRGSTLQAGVPEQFIVPIKPNGIDPDKKLWLSLVAETTAMFEFYPTEGWRNVR